MSARPVVLCNFCNRAWWEVELLLLGPQSDIAICSDCVEAAHKPIANYRRLHGWQVVPPPNRETTTSYQGEAMEPMQKFYMLKVENGGTPSAVHSTPESARGRAIALARGAKSRVAILGLEFVVTPELPETADILVRVERVEEQTTDPRFCTGLDERKPQT